MAAISARSFARSLAHLFTKAPSHLKLNSSLSIFISLGGVFELPIMFSSKICWALALLLNRWLSKLLPKPSILLLRRGAFSTNNESKSGLGEDVSLLSHARNEPATPYAGCDAHLSAIN
mgnify:CR=1 FL=1